MAYGTTTRDELIYPEILLDAIQGEFKGKQFLLGTGAAVVSNSLPGDKKGGDTVRIPYFGTLGEMEDIENEGDALTPEKLSMTDETATVKHSGKAFERTEWAALSEAGDSYAEAARQFGILVQRRVDRALIDAATKNLPAEYVLDFTAVGDGKFSYDMLVDATEPWGDEGLDDVALLGMHPKTKRDLLKTKDTTGRPLFVLPTTDDNIPRFMGTPVVTSSKCKLTGTGADTVYETLLIKRNALAFWFQGTPRVLTGEDILADSAVVAIHMYWAAHRYKRQRGSTYAGVIKILHK